jgi:hypothetical protein
MPQQGEHEAIRCLRSRTALSTVCVRGSDTARPDNVWVDSLVAADRTWHSLAALRLKSNNKLSRQFG